MLGALLQRGNQFVVFGFDVLNELVFGAGGPWCGAMKHFIKNEAQGPNVAFGGVRL